MYESHPANESRVRDIRERTGAPRVQSDAPLAIALKTSSFLSRLDRTAPNRLDHAPCPKRRRCCYRSIFKPLSSSRNRSPQTAPTTAAPPPSDGDQRGSASADDETRSINSLEAFLLAKREQFGLRDGERLPEAVVLKRLKKIRKVIMMIDGCKLRRHGMLPGGAGYWDKKLGLFVRGAKRGKGKGGKLGRGGKHGKGGRYGRGGKSGKSGKYGKPGRTGKGGKDGQKGKTGKKGAEGKRGKDGKMARFDENGNLTDSNGNLIDSMGNLIDTNGNVINGSCDKNNLYRTQSSILRTKNGSTSVTSKSRSRSQASSDSMGRRKRRYSSEDAGFEPSLDFRKEPADGQSKSTVALSQLPAESSRIEFVEGTFVSSANNILIRTLSGNFMPMPVGCKVLTLTGHILVSTPDAYLQQMSPDETWQSLQKQSLYNAQRKLQRVCSNATIIDPHIVKRMAEMENGMELSDGNTPPRVPLDEDPEMYLV